MSSNPAPRSWPTVLGYALGVGICFTATLGVWLQYSTSTFTAWSAGLLSLAIGIVAGGGWALLRRGAAD